MATGVDPIKHLREIEKWHNATEAGNRAGVSGQYMKKLARQGKIRHLNTALGVLYDPIDVERYRDERIRKGLMK